MKSPHTLPSEADLLGELLLGVTRKAVKDAHATVERYSEASELDADEWDAEHRLAEKIRKHNAHLGATEEPCL